MRKFLKVSNPLSWSAIDRQILLASLVMLLPSIMLSYAVVIQLSDPTTLVFAYFIASVVFCSVYLLLLIGFIVAAVKRRHRLCSWHAMEQFVILSYVVGVLFTTYLFGVHLTLGLLLLFIGISIVCALGNPSIIYRIYWWVTGLIILISLLQYFGFLSYSPILTYSQYDPQGRPNDTFLGLLVVIGFIASLIMYLATVSVESWVEREGQYKKMSMLDDLTGLMNRRAFLDLAGHEISRSQRRAAFQKQAPYLGCIMLDLDHFKNINDNFGHDAGDEVLRLCAELIAQQVRPYDLVSRFGGEEFSVLLPSADHASSVEVASRICEAINNLIVQGHNYQINVTASIGVSCFPVTHQQQLEELLRVADDALYAAKRQGRNQVIFKSFTEDRR